MKIVVISFFILGLVYLLWPGPSGVNDFSNLRDSLKSSEPGDTIENPQRIAFFTNDYRGKVINFYLKEYQTKNLMPFAPIRINHPPEFAYVVVKDQLLSTYLEELTYPMRSSLFINGFEPFYEDGNPKFKGATSIVVDGTTFNTKTTIRFYPSYGLIRILVWIGATLSLFWLLKLGRKIINA